MSEIMYNRFRSIFRTDFPENLGIENPKNLGKSQTELVVNIAFQKIGYTPKDFDKSFEKVWAESRAETFYDFAFEVWLEDV